MESKIKLKRIRAGCYATSNGKYIIYKAINKMWKVRKAGGFGSLLEADTLRLLRLYYNQYGTFEIDSSVLE